MSSGKVILTDLQSSWAPGIRTVWVLRWKWMKAPFVTILHVDPAPDEEIDSCGWDLPQPTHIETERIRELVHFKYVRPILFGETSDQERAEMVRRLCWIFRICKAVVRGRDYTTIDALPMLSRKERQAALVIVFRQSQGLRAHFHVPPEDADEGVQRLLLFLRIYKGLHRRWWQHPRWHVRHWKWVWQFRRRRTKDAATDARDS